MPDESRDPSHWPYRLRDGVGESATAFLIPSLLTYALTVTGLTIRGVVFAAVLYGVAGTLILAHVIRSEKLWSQRYAAGFFLSTLAWFALVPAFLIPFFHEALPYGMLAFQTIMTIYVNLPRLPVRFKSNTKAN